MEQAQIQRLMRALGSPIRREILWRVWRGELPVAEISDGLNLAAATVSGHLAVLREAGLVDMRPEGTTRWYRARQEAVAGLRGLFDDTAKWASGFRAPEQDLVSGETASVVIVRADAPCDQAFAFAAFLDAALYSQWLGAEVTLEDGHFTCLLEDGTNVRGDYVFVCAPALIVMDWDFNVKDVPVPGASRRAQLVIEPQGAGRCRLELHQFVVGPEQARYMDLAWRYVLGRFTARIGDVRVRARGRS